MIKKIFHNRKVFNLLGFVRRRICIYEYVEAKAEGVVFSSANHRELINEYVERGFRFVTAIPTSFSGYGMSKIFDLVFEIKVD